MTCSHSKTKDLYRYDGISLTQCQECFLIFNNSYSQHLSPEDLYQNYYDGETGSRFHFGMELLVRLFRLIRAFKITTIAPEARRILDVGSGRGFMLYYLKKYWGYERAVGTQISSSAVQFSRRELGLDIIERDLLEVQLDE